jgi:hypothetical protein
MPAIARMARSYKSKGPSPWLRAPLLRRERGRFDAG